MEANKYNDQFNSQTLNNIKERSFEILRKFDSNSEKAFEINKALLFNILKRNENSEFGKKFRFNKIKDYDEYCKLVPFTNYQDYKVAIDRMIENGDENIITSDPIVYFADTSGTTGNIKKVPVSEKSLNIFRNYASAVMPAVISEYYKNTKNRDCPDGYRLMLLHFHKQALKTGAYFGCISASCLNDEEVDMMDHYISTPKDIMFCSEEYDFNYLHAFFALSKPNIVYITGSYMSVILDFANYIADNWELLCDDISNGRFNENIKIPDRLRKNLESKLQPNPKRAQDLKNEFTKGLDDSIFKRIWPDLSAVCGIWAGCFNYFAWEMQKFTGQSIPYYTMSYTMSEGVIGIARHPFDQCYVLIPDSCFYEFIPQDKELNNYNNNTLLIDEVEAGKEYELIITNFSGFYRYKTGDIIKVIGFYNESPIIVFKYRKNNIISLVGEVFTEEHLASAIKGFTDKTGIKVKDYCLYPNRRFKPPRYDIYMEPYENVNLNKIEIYEKIFFNELCKACTDFKDFNIGKSKIKFLQKNAFNNFKELRVSKNKISNTQIKPIRVFESKEILDYFNSLEVK